VRRATAERAGGVEWDRSGAVDAVDATEGPFGAGRSDLFPLDSVEEPTAVRATARADRVALAVAPAPGPECAEPPRVEVALTGGPATAA
jgi:hypothetical protein